MFTNLCAARELKKSKPDCPLKKLLDESVTLYNKKMAKKRTYIITGNARSMTFNSARCTSETVQEFQAHYLIYKHNESGTPRAAHAHEST